MGKYDDILKLPRPKSLRRKMTMTERAAQFSPFAALSGYEDAISETARLTERQIALGESEMLALSEKISLLQMQLSKRPKAQATYFVPDETKSGGKYETIEGSIQKIRAYEKELVFEGGRTVPFERILSLESDLFDE